MLLSLLLFESEFLHIVAISYTALVINELIMVALEITTWHNYMILSEVGTGVVYFGSMVFLPEYFGMFSKLTSIISCRLHPSPQSITTSHPYDEMELTAIYQIYHSSLPPDLYLK